MEMPGPFKLSLPRIHCESQMFVKENLDRKNYSGIRSDIFHLGMTKCLLASTLTAKTYRTLLCSPFKTLGACNSKNKTMFISSHYYLF